MKILCAVDRTLSSCLAVEGMAKLFHQSLKEVVLCHVLDSRVWAGERKRTVSQQTLVKTVTKKMESLGKTTLKEMRERFELAFNQSSTKPLTVVNSQILKGHVTDSLIKLVERVQPDLVVVGSRGINDLPGYLLGSVSRQILLHSPSSVFVVKGKIEAPMAAVIAVDGSKSSKFATNRAKRWLSSEDVRIHLAAVVPEVITDIAPTILSATQLAQLRNPARQRTQEFLNQFREVFLKEGFRVTKEMLQGHPRECLLALLERRKTQLVVLGSKGLTGIERFSMGSVSEWIGTYAPASVLVIRR